MKKLLPFFITILISQLNFAQDCEYNITTTEDGTELKTTKEYLMYERILGNSSQFMFFSLTNIDGIPVLTFQYLAKDKDFPPIYCIDKTSRIYIQLTNGKVVSLISATDDQCSGLVYDEVEKNNIRVLSGTFLFASGSMEDLEKSTMSFIRIKYATGQIDYPMRTELLSENNGSLYKPDSYFINTLKCIKD